MEPLTGQRKDKLTAILEKVSVIAATHPGKERILDHVDVARELSGLNTKQVVSEVIYL